jgi:WD40 repeat protein
MLILEGTPGLVAALAFSPDGQSLAIADAAGRVRLWEHSSEVNLHKSESVVQVLAFSPDGRFLVGGGPDQFITVWDVFESRISRFARPEQFPIASLAFVGPGTVLFGIGDRAGKIARPTTLFLFDLANGQTRKFSFGVPYGIRAIAGLPDRRVAAWATDTKLLRLQDITRPPSKAVVLKNDCRALALSADGRLLAITSDWEILVFDVEREWPANPNTLGRHKAVVTTLAFGPDGRTLYAGGGDGVVKVWDVDRGSERSSYAWPIGNRVQSLAVSPDGLRAAAGGDIGTVAVWDLD